MDVQKISNNMIQKKGMPQKRTVSKTTVPRTWLQWKVIFLLFEKNQTDDARKQQLSSIVNMTYLATDATTIEPTQKTVFLLRYPSATSW